MAVFDGDRGELGRYLRELADLMGLRDWHINLMHDPPDNPDHAACVDVRYGRKVANIHFHPEWKHVDPESLRSTCVHELLHCHLKATEWALEGARLPLGLTAFTILESAYTDALEVGIDAIATEWAKTLPLPIHDIPDVPNELVYAS